VLLVNRALLVVAEQNGNHLRECWTEVLRCVSRFELLQQMSAGVPTDALLFAMPDKAGAADKLKRRIMPRRKGAGEEEGGLARDSASSIQNMGLHASEHAGMGGSAQLPHRWLASPLTAPRRPASARPLPVRHACVCLCLHDADAAGPSCPAAGTREVDKKQLPPADVMASVDVQELNRLFVNSGRLDSEAIVQFVKTLGAVAQEELRPVACPRVFSLNKIVEIAHFNMGRIRWVGVGEGGGQGRGAQGGALTSGGNRPAAQQQRHPIPAMPCLPPPSPPPPCRRRAGWCGAASGRCWPTSSSRWGATPTWRWPCTRWTRCASWP
jgi:brefeldin A-inhibited guanine nucleotide-exchange protein